MRCLSLACRTSGQQPTEHDQSPYSSHGLSKASTRQRISLGSSPRPSKSSTAIARSIIADDSLLGSCSTSAVTLPISAASLMHEQTAGYLLLFRLSASCRMVPRGGDIKDRRADE